MNLMPIYLLTLCPTLLVVWVQAHPIIVAGVAAWAGLLMIDALPPPTPASSTAYRVIHHVLNAIAGNIRKIMASRFPGVPLPELEEPQKTA